MAVSDLHKSFGAVEVLKGISMTAEKGAVVSVIGASGSGKSTFLRCINLLETYDAGDIHIFGEKLRIGPKGRATPSIPTKPIPISITSSAPTRRPGRWRG